MEKHPLLPMTPFDSLVTSFELQMMKLMLPYTPASYRPMLACYIKFTELINTFQYFQQSSNKRDRKDTFAKHPSSPLDILEDLRPYMDEKDSGMIDNLLSAMNMMEMMKGMDIPDPSNMGDMSDMMEMMNMFSGNPGEDNESNDKNNQKQENENNDNE